MQLKDAERALEQQREKTNDANRELGVLRLKQKLRDEEAEKKENKSFWRTLTGKKE